MAAALCVALVLRAGGAPRPAWAAFTVTAALTLWWSAPRARPPGPAGRVAFVLAAAVMAASASIQADWPLGLMALALALGVPNCYRKGCLLSTLVL